MDKRVGSYEEALAGLTDNMTILSGGFGLCGTPENLIAEIRRRGTQVAEDWVPREPLHLRGSDRRQAGRPGACPENELRLTLVEHAVA